MDAHGDGPLAATLEALPSDLTRISLSNGGSFPETRVIELIDGRKQVAAHGPRQMPVWGERYRLKHVLDEDPNVIERRARGRIEALVKYLISIQKK